MSTYNFIILKIFSLRIQYLQVNLDKIFQIIILKYFSFAQKRLNLHLNNSIGSSIRIGSVPEFKRIFKVLVFLGYRLKGFNLKPNF
jgi:hypothetical protein